MSREQEIWQRPLGRRAFLAGVGGAGAAVGASRIGRNLGTLTDSLDPPDTVVVPFHGAHQAGIDTRVQDYLNFAAFDLVADSRQDVADLLRLWSEAASRMCAGEPVEPVDDNLLAPPGDTGEALGAGPSRLTVTFGLGPGLFERDGTDRYGLADQRPAALVDLPAFAGEELQADRVGGDIAVQACADDPVVAFHAVHNLTRIGHGAVVQRWSQLGFGRTSSTTRDQQTPRNLMGFKDGTNNIRSDDTRQLDSQVWVGDEGPSWMRGGTYLVARRIRILLEAWDRSTLGEQQRTIGRNKRSGAPLGGVDEFDPIRLDTLDSTGQPLIPENAHIRLASPEDNGGALILRRGYSFDDGIDELGELDVGLFFICFQRDIRQQFVRIQQRLSANDALNRYIRHTGSAVFACPSGVRDGDWVASSLFTSPGPMRAPT
jgi:deferrochelatase/peroxidase EfeB